MKSSLLFCLLMVVSCTVPSGRNTDTSPLDRGPFEERVFAERCSIATSLMIDDIAAWKTSDYITTHFPRNVLDSLDETWFVIPENGSRTVFYGKYLAAQNEYQPKFEFLVKSDTSVQLVNPALSTDILLYAKAVFTGTRQFKILCDSLMFDFSFNHYLRKNPDATFSMWFFPAGMETYCPYGLEAFLTIDQSGSKVKDISLTGNELKYFEVTRNPDSLVLDNTFDGVPTIGNIFFICMFGKYFKRITIQNYVYQSTPSWSDEQKCWLWTHTSKTQSSPD